MPFQASNPYTLFRRTYEAYPVKINLEKHRDNRDRPVEPCSRDLVRRAQKGDTSAFEHLYRMQVGRIYALCVRMVADPVRAEILTQDAFVQAWQKLGSFQGDSAFSTWLHRLAVNVVLTDLRSERRRTGRVEPTDDLAPINGVAREPVTDLAMDLDASIAGLPTQARAVFVLYDIEGYRHEEIAEMLGIAVGSSKAHLHHARKRLRATLSSK